MKILVVCQHYHPEPFTIPDICKELVKRGHEVDVVTGIPNYPMGTIYEGYRHGKKRDEILEGVRVHRTFTVGRRRNTLFRILNYYSFALSSSLYTARLKKEYDAVLVNQLSPVMMACAGVKYKKKHGTRLVFYTLDLWPESLIAGGIKRDGLVYNVFNRISKRLYQQADRILVTSEKFIPYLEKQHGIDKNRLAYLPQYAEDLFRPEELPEKQTVDLTFAGNVGKMQSVGTLIKAAALLKDQKELRFHIVGDGSDLETCQALARELACQNVLFHGRRPKEEMPAFYKNSDAMLVSMKDDPLISLTLPGKIQSYMAAGKPIIGAIGGEAAEVIKKAECGPVCPPDDPEMLAKSIRLFLKSDKKALGINARSYYDRHFTKKQFIDHLISELSNEKA
ncbi:MAG: glycosyltransferase family 4 protein [Clostridia bacterium]|nr:glycosyltransferase family 4 protein [Clostridia bacterium]